MLPFTANSLNIFVTAVVSSLPNVTANDIIIGPVRMFAQLDHQAATSLVPVEGNLVFVVNRRVMGPRTGAHCSRPVKIRKGLCS